MSHEFQFTHDWFSGNIPVWKKHLRTLTDKPAPTGGPLSALEIGCYEGRATVWLLENVLTHPLSTIDCIDTFEGGKDHDEAGVDFSGVEARFIHNTKPWWTRVNLEVGESDWILCRFHQERRVYDLIYVDGSHVAEDVFLDLILSWRMLAPGGILIMDDYGWGSGRPASDTPKPAIDEFLSVFADRFELLHKDYQVIVRRL